MLKEKGYIPVNLQVTSGTVSFKASRYYVSVLIDVQDINDYLSSDNQGIGIDVGIKDFAIVNTIEQPFKNINKDDKLKVFVDFYLHFLINLINQFLPRKREYTKLFTRPI